MGVEAEHNTGRMEVQALQYSLPHTLEEAAFISWGHSNKWPQADSGHLTEIYSLTALVARGFNQGVSRAVHPPKVLEESPFPASPLVAAGAPWLVSAPSPSLPPSSHGLVCD